MLSSVWLSLACVGLVLAAAAWSAVAEPAYTNHAGEAISGRVVELEKKTVTLESNGRQTRYPLSIFQPLERRRLACDAGQPAVLDSLAPAFKNYRHVISRCRARRDAQLITSEQCAAQCALARDVMLKALEKADITPQERAAFARDIRK